MSWLLCNVLVFMQEEQKEIGETSPSDLWSPKPLDTKRWYFQREDKTKVLEGSSVDALIAMPDPTNTKLEFVSIILNL